MAQIKIALVVGHGIQPNGVWDPGAVNAGAQLNEQTAGDIVVGTAAAILDRSGHFDVHSEARDPDDPNWVGSARHANDWGADVVVSVHHDWTGGVDGAHGFYYSSASPGRDLGDRILAAIGDAGFNVRRDWFKARPELGLLRTTRAPTFLLECGRIGSKALDSPEELRAMGVAVAAGILDHFDLPSTQETAMARTRKQIAATIASWPADSWQRKLWDRARALGLVNLDTDPLDSMEKLEGVAFVVRAIDTLGPMIAANRVRIARLEKRVDGLSASDVDEDAIIDEVLNEIATRISAA